MRELGDEQVVFYFKNGLCIVAHPYEWYTDCVAASAGKKNYGPETRESRGLTCSSIPIGEYSLYPT
jgi:hypothetical protein